MSSGNSQHHLDSRVHCAKPEGADWKLHQCLLSAIIYVAIACSVHGALDGVTVRLVYLCSTFRLYMVLPYSFLPPVLSFGASHSAVCSHLLHHLVSCLTFTSRQSRRNVSLTRTFLLIDHPSLPSFTNDTHKPPHCSSFLSITAPRLFSISLRLSLWATECRAPSAATDGWTITTMHRRGSITKDMSLAFAVVMHRTILAGVWVVTVGRFKAHKKRDMVASRPPLLMRQWKMSMRCRRPTSMLLKVRVDIVTSKVPFQLHVRSRVEELLISTTLGSPIRGMVRSLNRGGRLRLSSYLLRSLSPM